MTDWVGVDGLRSNESKPRKRSEAVVTGTWASKSWAGKAEDLSSTTLEKVSRSMGGL